MMSKKIEIMVGVFVALGIAALLTLALKVADAGFRGNGDTYRLYAKFDNIGGLKERSAVKVGGVIVGRVAAIELDSGDYMPKVALDIDSRYDAFSESTSISILTAGLLGEQYIGLEPGFIDEDMGIGLLADGDFIEDTKSALVLEDLIGQFLFSQDDN
ncbi:outer membrane lipid asymmetry maintenance protein MlaD [Thalassotalea ponticola]|uniref:outer membrane lipid asymmetry maintenance protein MlaD n=1 Tax=Thalassotalea ponticola TaxID=1523392 RepID=UPI0025B5E735|nr:outer membrane lipid asymmetry maintenance protein MlaD [Thalassotalea ponticola]MDN3653524.1 outer membrane lipid asymmetry maintenance protein MlaD [Thalassotalea ponticola]